MRWSFCQAKDEYVVEQWLSYDVLGHTGIPVLVMPFQVFESCTE